MGKVKVVNRVDMLSFAISSEEEDTEKVDADSLITVIQAVRMNWLNLKFVQPDNFRDIEPSRKNQPAKTHDKMLENTGVHITYRNLLFKKMHHATTLYTLLCALLHSTQRSTCMPELINKVHKLYLLHKFYTINCTKYMINMHYD